MFINCVCHNSVKSGWQAGGPLGRSSSETAEVKAAWLAAGWEQQERTLPLPMVRGVNANWRGLRGPREDEQHPSLDRLRPLKPFLLIDVNINQFDLFIYGGIGLTFFLLRYYLRLLYYPVIIYLAARRKSLQVFRIGHFYLKVVSHSLYPYFLLEII